MIARFVTRIVVNAIALRAAAALIPRMEFSGRFVNLLTVSVPFGLVNALIRPIVIISRATTKAAFWFWPVTRLPSADRPG